MIFWIIWGAPVCPHTLEGPSSAEQKNKKQKMWALWHPFKKKEGVPLSRWGVSRERDCRICLATEACTLQLVVHRLVVVPRGTTGALVHLPNDRVGLLLQLLLLLLVVLLVCGRVLVQPLQHVLREQPPAPHPHPHPFQPYVFRTFTWAVALNNGN